MTSLITTTDRPVTDHKNKLAPIQSIVHWTKCDQRLVLTVDITY